MVPKLTDTACQNHEVNPDILLNANIYFSVTLLKTSSGAIQFDLFRVDKYHPNMCKITSYVFFPQNLDQRT